MALRTVTKSGGGLRYASKMQTNETVSGFYMGTKEGVSKNPKWKPPMILVLQTETGQTIDLYAAGSLNYIENNAEKDPSQKLFVGQFTVITKTGSYKNKQGRDFQTFSIQQDDQKMLPAEAQAAQTTIQDRLNKARQAG